ncbi:hypothetical protein MMC17_009815 [Xylographa soralifera]|nr:hypothetical protein [Xylographa soralifera]
MPGIPSRPDLKFDLFDSLGLNPTASTINPSSVQKAWRRVNLHLHPDKVLSATHVPAFPTYVQARQAKEYLLAEEKGASDPQSRIRITLASGKHSYRSTWNPWATPNTEEVLKPMPGAPTVATHGPADSKSDWKNIDPQFGSDHVFSGDCQCGSCEGKRWADEYRARRDKQHRAERERAEENERRRRGSWNPFDFTCQRPDQPKEEKEKSPEKERKQREWFDRLWSEFERMGCEDSGTDWFLPKYHNHRCDCDCGACKEWRGRGAKEKFWREYNGVE